jgi:TonB family protein
MIALNLHPAVGAPPDPPAGNRRGTFAATPEGHRGASGAAGASAGSGKESAGGSGKKSSGDLPAGLYVGKASNAPSPVAGDPATKNSSAYAVNPNLIANARPARVSAQPMQPASESKLSQEERAVFGNRKFYSLSLNMPNLNSAGGSWIIRFAQLKPDASAGSTSAGVASSAATSSAEPAADLSAPSATRKVDPAYPLELMRQNVGGTVILYGVIHADGTVGSVRVLRSADDRLDQFASDAIAKWQFQPATKNGAPVDVEATFWIPFRPPKF